MQVCKLKCQKYQITFQLRKHFKCLRNCVDGDNDSFSDSDSNAEESESQQGPPRPSPQQGTPQGHQFPPRGPQKPGMNKMLMLFIAVGIVMCIIVAGVLFVILNAAGNHGGGSYNAISAVRGYKSNRFHAGKRHQSGAQLPAQLPMKHRQSSAISFAGGAAAQLPTKHRQSSGFSLAGDDKYKSGATLHAGKKSQSGAAARRPTKHRQSSGISTFISMFAGDDKYKSSANPTTRGIRKALGRRSSQSFNCTSKGGVRGRQGSAPRGDRRLTRGSKM